MEPREPTEAATSSPGTSTSPSHGPGSRVRRIVFLAIAGAFVLGVLFAFREVLAPFAVAMVVAYVFAPVVEAMEKLRVAGRRMPRWVAVLTLYLALLGTMAAGLAIGVPLLVGQVQRLAHETPRTVQQLRTEWIPAIDARIRALSATVGDEGEGEGEREGEGEGEDEGEELVSARGDTIRVVPLDGGGYEVQLPEDGLVLEQEDEHRLVLRPAVPQGEGAPRRDLASTVTAAIQRQMRQSEQTIGQGVEAVRSFVAALVNGIFKFFIMLMISAYLLISSDNIFRFFRTLVSPARRAQFDTLLRRMDRGLAGVVRGQLVICVVNGVLSAIGFSMIGLHYWPILALFATLLSIIPIFGAILSSIPAVIVGLQQGIGVAVFTLLWIIGIHQIEANFLNPKIMGDAAKVHPVLVVFSLIAGEHFFGILGALLAVPVLSIAQTLFLWFREQALGEPASSTSPGLSVPPVAPAPAAAATPEPTPDTPPSG